LTRLKAQPQTYPQLDLAYSAAEPVAQPVILTLPANGIRLRFDGPDQRLRLVEVLDFSKTSLTYKNNEVVRQTRSSNEGASEQETQATGPPFRHVYNRLFGPTYPGEYVRPEPNNSSEYGIYVLSYPGVAFSFPLKHAAWSEKSDFVSLMSSSAASAATSMCVFNGSSWPEARSNLFTRAPPFPRSIALLGRNKEYVPDEIEDVNIYGAGQIVLLRRTAPRFSIKLGETTPQDLVAELGPPDAIYRKSDTRINIHGSSAVDDLSPEPPSAHSMRRARSKDSNASSSRSFTGESDVDSPVAGDEDRPVINPDCFYNYFHHGFDVLISFPTGKSPPFPGAETGDAEDLLQSHPVVTKIFLHANVPGSYPFNRHRRSRWQIFTDPADPERPVLTSEMPFNVISEDLKKMWKGCYASPEEEKSMQRGMVLNRGWGDSPGSSIELLGGFDDHPGQKLTRSAVEDGAQGLGNTQLFGFPGLLFEVLKNGTVSCLTVY
jgi:hypothetical protein